MAQYGGPTSSPAPGGPIDRSFNYDSLSRLIQAFNPESGWTCYGTTGGAAANGSNCTEGYDGNGNLMNKTDARAITTSYTYDSLNRILTKSYGTSSSLVSCSQYDTATNGTGRLGASWTQFGSCATSPPAVACTSSSQSCYQSLRAFGSYDVMGRVSSEQQCVLGFCTSSAPPSAPSQNCASLSTAAGIAYCYDLAGDLTAYSNGLTSTAFPQQWALFSQTYDSAARLASVTVPSSPISPWSGSNPALPPNLFTVNPTSGYTPLSTLQNWTMGTNLSVNKTYDPRQRVSSETATQP